MASYRFKWPHAADEVIVTGTFDNWAKDTKLDQKGRFHEKVVEIPETKDEILYKFVVNGQWRTDPSHAVKKDHEGNENNVLDPDDIIPSASGASGAAGVAGAGIAGAAGAGVAGAAAVGVAGAAGAGMLSSSGPGASTTGLAGAQPLEEDTRSVPGAFPEEQTQTQSPAGVSTLQDRVMGVNPIPATSGIGNPVNLQPGEKVPDPSTLTNNTIQSTATMDKESYERSAGGAAYSPVGRGDDSAALFGRPAAGGTTIPESTADRAIDSSAGQGNDSAALFGRPAAGGTMIPESSLPMGDQAGSSQKDYTDPAITSAGPGSTTAALAGQQPIEPRGTPEVVSKSDDTGKDEGILGNSEETSKDEALSAKADDASKDGGISGKAAAGVAAAGVGTAGAAAVGANYLFKDDDTSKDTTSAQPQSTQDEVVSDADRATTANVPKEVVESQKEADLAPEAAANAEAVKEKSEAEKELLSKVPETNAQGEPAPTDSAAAATTVPTTTSDTGAPQLGDPVAGGLAPIKMNDKADDSANHLRDVSPGTKPTTTTQTQPVVTSGVADKSTAQTSTPQTPTTQKAAMDKMKSYGSPASESKSTPASKTTPGSSTSTPGSTSKTEKRRSFLKRLKDKLTS